MKIIDDQEIAYQAALAMPLERKIEKSILLYKEFQNTAKSWDMFEPWYHLCTSGGKDSVVADCLAVMAGVPFKRYHSFTTIDPPELIRFTRKHFQDCIELHPDKPLLTRFWQDEGQGPPTRLARWCCEIYKEQGCIGQIKVFGIRAEESHSRKIGWKLWTPWTIDRSWVLNPILYWTEQNVWDFIDYYKLPYCELYDEEEIERLGCIGCPMAGTCGRLFEFKRWPLFERAWKMAFKKFWQKWHGVPRKRETWVSCEGKHQFSTIAGERSEKKYVKERDRIEEGFWTFRRWYDLKGYKTWQELWHWWMQDEEEVTGCDMGLS